MKRAVAALAVLIALGVLTGCGAPPGARPRAVPSADLPRPVGVQDPAPSSSAGATDPGEGCEPRRSLAPRDAMTAPGATVARIRARGRLIVGVDQNTYLFGYRDPKSGDLVGFDIDIAHEIARAIFGNPDAVQFIAISYAARIPKVTDGTVDLVADTMTVNCDRWAKVNFSTIYYDAGQRVLVPRDSNARGITDLGGKRVCAARGSTSIQNVQDAKVKPPAVAVGVDDWTDCLVLLQQGQVDAISTDDTILAGMAAQDPFTKLVGEAFTTEPYGLAIAIGNEDFVRFVNGVLAQMRANGTWAAIYARWLGTPVPAPPAAEYKD